MPLWVWNTRMEKAGIEAVLEMYHRQGLGGAFVHPRPGLITEYLSEEWFELWGYALQKAKSLGMELHVYDENTYPSGFAGGYVAEAMPEAVATYLVCVSEVPDGAEVLAEGKGREGEERFVCLMKSAPSGWAAGFPYPDCSDRKVTECFIRSTHEKYAERFSGDLGGAIKYFFFDEPELAFGMQGLPYTESILRTFERLHGYDFRDHLLGFFEGAGDEVSGLRHDYYMALHETWLENFLNPLCEWAGEKGEGVGITGHVMEHTWPDPGKHATAMSAYKRMQMPGIDLLGFQYRHGDYVSNEVLTMTSRELRSIANQFSKPRVMTELHGGGGYEYTPENAKQYVDWALVHGINFINQHLSYQSLCGTRKHDFPQTFSSHSPWFDVYRGLGDYEARLCYLLSQGREVNRTLVLQPTTSAWLDFVPNTEKKRPEDPTHPLAPMQWKFARLLEQAHVDFDFGDEFVMKEDAAVRNGAFVVGDREYGLVVIPEGTRNLLKSSVALLRQYMDAGGRVLCGSTGLGYIEGRPDKLLEELVGHVNWCAVEGSDALVQKTVEAFSLRTSFIRKCSSFQDVCFLRKELGEGELFFLTNNSNEPVEMEFDFEGEGWWEMDPWSGTVRKAPGSVTLCKSGSLTLFHGALDKGFVVDQGEPEALASVDLNQARIDSISRVSPNVLTLDYCDLEVQGERIEDVYAVSANRTVWQKNGLGDAPRYWSVEFRKGVQSREFGADTGFECRYRFEIGEGVDWSEFEVAVEHPEIYEISVNGSRLDFSGASPWLDPYILRAKAGAFLREGSNELCLKCSPIHHNAEVASAFLLGDFSVSPHKGFCVEPPKALEKGDVTGQGCPFYHEGISYKATFEVKEGEKSGSLSLPDWRGSCVRIWLGGRELAPVLYHAQKIVIDEPLSPGEHQVEWIVYGNLRNLLGPHFDQGIPTRFAWESNSAPRRAGSDYRFEPLCGACHKG